MSLYIKQEIIQQTNCVNTSISEGLFHDSLESANTAPVYEKNNPLDKENCRPVNILPLLSNVCESAMCKELSEYIKNL